MVKADSKTGQKYVRKSNGSGIRMSGFGIVTVFLLCF
jgi:hypothetical protein